MVLKLQAKLFMSEEVLFFIFSFNRILIFLSLAIFSCFTFSLIFLLWATARSTREKKIEKQKKSQREEGGTTLFTAYPNTSLCSLEWINDILIFLGVWAIGSSICWTILVCRKEDLVISVQRKHLFWNDVGISSDINACGQFVLTGQWKAGQMWRNGGVELQRTVYLATFTIFRKKRSQSPLADQVNTLLTICLLTLHLASFCGQLLVVKGNELRELCAEKQRYEFSNLKKTRQRLHSKRD